VLEHLDGHQFEHWSRTVLERHLACRVDTTPAAGDEGRDLIAYNPDGSIRLVVECKHQRSAVGRPVVQKLHSAVLTCGATHGMVLTTSRFSPGAIEYARNLTDIRLDLVDGTQLARIAHDVGMTDRSFAAGAVTTPTSPDLGSLMRSMVLIPPRYTPGGRWVPTLQLKHDTTYDCYYVSRYQATGSLRTASGEATASWSGTVWCTDDGREWGLGDPPGTFLSEQTLVLLTTIPTAPGVAPPRQQLHEAEQRLRELLAGSLSKPITYSGRNNQVYRRTVAPSAGTIRLSSTRPVYAPRTTFRMRSVDQSGAEQRIAGALAEIHPQGAGGPVELAIRSDDLSECTTCRRPTTPETQIVCAVCLRAAHRATCTTCGAVVCRSHARRSARSTPVCIRCADASAPPLRPRWLPHLVAALVVWAILTCGTILLGAPAWPAILLGVLAGLPVVTVAMPGTAGEAGWVRYPGAAAGAGPAVSPTTRSRTIP
jgi:restriction system protein